MNKPIVRDVLVLGQKSEPATKADIMGPVDIVMFNPVITKKDTPYDTEEGCLSLTGVRKTTRYENIEVEYYDMQWKKQIIRLSGWPAQICQHECDHLQGIII